MMLRLKLIINILVCEIKNLLNVDFVVVLVLRPW